MKIKEIKERYQNPLGDTVFTHVYIIKPIAFYVAWLCILLRIPADLLTVATILLGFLAAISFSYGTFTAFIVGAILGYVRSIIDNMDGVVARALATSSLRGKYLDRIAQRIADPLMFVGISLGIYASNPQLHYVLLGFSASLSMILLYTFITEREVILLTSGHQKQTAGKGNTSYLTILKRLHDRIGFLFRVPALLNIIFIAALVNKMKLLLIVYGIGFPVLATAILLHEYLLFFREN